MTRDIQASILRACARFIAKRLDPLELRLKAVEERGAVIHKGLDGIHGRDGRDGKDGERGPPGEKGADGLNGKDGRDGIDGKDGAPGLNGKDGRDGVDGKDGAPGRDGVDGLPGKDGADGKDGLPGKDGAPGERGPVGPAGEKGADGINGKDGADGRDGKDGRDGIDGKDGANGLDGKDGAPGLNGKDGRDGVDGKSVTLDDVRPMLEAEVSKWALDFERRAAAVLERAIDRMPKARDGVDGKDGRDGIDWSEFDAYLADDGRTIVVKMGRGETQIVKELKTSIPLFRGSWNASETYEKGDCVNWGGNMWIARETVSERPTKSDAWQMAVRRGADAKVS